MNQYIAQTTQRYTRQSTSAEGFTFLEFLLYIALTSIMVVVLGNIGIHILASRAKSHALEEVSYSTQFISEYIIRSVEESDAVTTPPLGATSSSLVLEKSDSAQNPTIFSVVDGVLMATEGTTTHALTGSTTQITSIDFTNVAAADTPDAVRITMTIASKNPTGNQSFAANESWSTTATTKKTP